MRARHLVSRAPHELTVEDHEIPDEPPPGAILAEAVVTLVSAGTEIANYQGRTAHRPLDGAEPYYPGYSFAGTVLAVGDGMERFAPGDRVCGPLPHASRVVEARPERLARLTTIPDGVPFVGAAFTQLGCIALNAVRTAGIELGARVAVVGAGVVGLLAGRLARLAGGRRITALDLLEARREAATRNRAYAAIDPADPAAAQRLAEIAPGGFDVVFEATESAAGFRSAFRLAGRGATVVLLGSTREPVDGFDPYADIHVKGLRVLGAHVATAPAEATLRDRWTEAENRRVLLELLQRGELDVEALISHRIAPEEAPKAFAALAARPQDHLGVVIDWR
jgi:2-desacetyl-2-hydroxyethyl bacteriochlorophyllide A dehydrogenase